MTEPTARRHLAGLLALVALEGFTHGWAAGVAGQVGPVLNGAFTLCETVLVYLWWCADARSPQAMAAHPPRPLWLSGFIIMLPWLGVPLYLWRSRGPGQRMAALCHFGLILLLLALIYLASGAPMAWWLGGL